MYYTFQKGDTKVWMEGGGAEIKLLICSFVVRMLFVVCWSSFLRKKNQECIPSEHRGLYHGFWEKKIYYTIEKCYLSLKQFGSRSGPTFCRFWSGPNCLQRLSADNTSWQRVNNNSLCFFRVCWAGDSGEGPLEAGDVCPPRQVQSLAPNTIMLLLLSICYQQKNRWWKNQVVQGLTKLRVWFGWKFQSGGAGVNSVGDLGENFYQVVQGLAQWVIWVNI